MNNYVSETVSPPAKHHISNLTEDDCPHSKEVLTPCNITIGIDNGVI